MVTRAVIAAALAVSVLAANPASAQDEYEVEGQQQVGTRFLQEPETVEAARARKMQKKVARCVYSSNEAEVEELLAKSDFHRIDFEALGVEAESLFDDLDVSRCIGRAMRDDEYRMHMRFPHSTMRNLLAKEAYLERNRVPLTLPSDAPDRLDNRYSMDGIYPPTVVIAEMGDCITRNDPAGAHEFLAQRPSSSGETEAFDKLIPTIGRCLKTEQEEVTLQISLMRQIVADALWSRFHYGPQAAAPASATASAQGAGK